MYTKIINDMPGHWQEAIREQLEEIKVLEIALMKAKGSLSQLKLIYVRALMDDIPWGRMKRAIVKSRPMKFDRIEIADGSCYLVFHPILPSGRTSKSEYALPYGEFGAVAWGE